MRGRELNSPLISRHLCNNRICVNPDHVIEGTKKENGEDRSKLITKCARGHEYLENIVYVNGHRRCRICLGIKRSSDCEVKRFKKQYGL